MKGCKEPSRTLISEIALVPELRSAVLRVVRHHVVKLFLAHLLAGQHFFIQVGGDLIFDHRFLRLEGGRERGREGWKKQEGKK